MSKEIERKEAQRVDIARADTALLEQRLDGLLRREVIRSAVEAVMIIAELAQRTAQQAQTFTDDLAKIASGERTVTPVDKCLIDKKENPDGAAG